MPHAYAVGMKRALKAGELAPPGGEPHRPLERTLDPNIVYVFTDGSSLLPRGDEPGFGGWAAVLHHDGRSLELSDGEIGASNNAMELQACIEGLKALRPNGTTPVHLVSDSMYVVNGLLGAAKIKSNLERFAELKALITPRVRVRWVKGHGGHAENETADRLAGAARRRVMAEWSKQRENEKMAQELAQAAVAAPSDPDGPDAMDIRIYGPLLAGAIAKSRAIARRLQAICRPAPVRVRVRTKPRD